MTPVQKQTLDRLEKLSHNEYYLHREWIAYKLSSIKAHLSNGANMAAGKELDSARRWLNIHDKP